MKARPILFSGPMVRALLEGRKTQTRRVVTHKGEHPPEWATFAQEIRSMLVGKPGWHPIGLFQWSEEQTPGEPLKRLRRWPCSDDVIPSGDYAIRCPYGKPGSLLAVKESAWMWCERRPNGTTKTGRPKWWFVPLEGAPIHFQSEHPKKPQVSITHPDTGNEWGWRLKLGRFLPRWASRLTLEITDVSVERLQDISEADAMAEGCDHNGPCDHARQSCEDIGCFGQNSYRGGYFDLWSSINGPGSWKANPWVWVIEFRVHQQNVDQLLPHLANTSTGRIP